jgi:type I restriction enzyme S subunit
VPGCSISAEQVIKYKLTEGDLVFARSGSIDKAWRVTGPPPGAVFASYLIRARPVHDHVGRWLEQFIRSPHYLAQVEAAAAGTGMQNVNATKLGELKVPVPPTGEQARILAKVQVLQAQSRQAREALDAVPPLLEKLRQSVLAAAFRGDLTRDWRAKHPDVEPASELLKRIRAERRKKWEEAELAKLKAKGKPPGDDRWKARYDVPRGADESSLPPLPAGWCWANLGEVAPLLPGFAFPSSGFTKAGVRLLKGVNVRDGHISEEDMDYWPAHEKNLYSRFLLNAGDIVLAMDRPVYSSGSRATKVARLSERWAGSLLLQRVGRFQNLPMLHSDYLFLYVQSYRFRDHLIRQQNGSQDGKDLPHVSASVVDAAVLPVPPTEEQRVAAVRAHAAISAIDGTRVFAQSVSDRLDDFEPALLRRAFSGKLVPQNPNDEPADVMLARLRESSEEQSAPVARRIDRRGNGGARQASRR